MFVLAALARRWRCSTLLVCSGLPHHAHASRHSILQGNEQIHTNKDTRD